MNRYKFTFAVTLVLFISLAFGCPSKKNEEKKQPAEATTKSEQLGEESQTSQTQAQQDPKSGEQPNNQKPDVPQEQPAQTVHTSVESTAQHMNPLCKKRFERRDLDKDGVLTFDELESFSEGLGQSLIDSKDQDGDGLLTLDEACSRTRVKPTQKPAELRRDNDNKNSEHVKSPQQAPRQVPTQGRGTE